jgi:hypothetical protein
MNDFIGMLVKGLFIVFVFIVMLFIIGFVFAWPLMWLWNYLMPVIFELPTITYWQSFWLFFLCGLLFKSSNSSSSSN